MSRFLTNFLQINLLLFSAERINRCFCVKYQWQKMFHRKLVKEINNQSFSAFHPVIGAVFQQSNLLRDCIGRSSTRIQVENMIDNVLVSTLRDLLFDVSYVILSFCDHHVYAGSSQCRRQKHYQRPIPAIQWNGCISAKRASILMNFGPNIVVLYWLELIW